MNTFINSLAWRYATKQYDTTKKVSDNDIMTILEAGRLAPSSFGLQPWKFILVENPETRKALRAAGWDQSQFTDASHLIVIATPKVFTLAHIDAYIAKMAKDRGISEESLAGFKSMLVGYYEARKDNPALLSAWMARQAYIALGMMLGAAATLTIDTTPMEGFDPSAFDATLGLSEAGLTSVVSLAVGYRSEDDKTSAYAKSRFDMEDVLIKK